MKVVGSRVCMVGIDSFIFGAKKKILAKDVEGFGAQGAQLTILLTNKNRAEFLVSHPTVMEGDYKPVGSMVMVHLQ